MRAALVASCFLGKDALNNVQEVTYFYHLGAFPPVDFLAVCLVRAIFGQRVERYACRMCKSDDWAILFARFLQIFSLIVFKQGEERGEAML